MRRRTWVIGGLAAGLVVVLVAVGLILALVVKPDIPGLPSFLTRATPSAEDRLAELEPLPPLVADRLPQQGVEMALDDNIVLFFDQPMDQTATVNAFRVNPPVAGGFNWLDDATLQFSPSQRLERATEYTVTISEGAASASGLAIREPIELEFQSVGFLEVSQVVPIRIKF